MSYLIVVPVPAYPMGDNRFAIEAAFAEHLRLLRTRLGPLARAMVLAAPEMSPDDYAKIKASMAVIDLEQDGIEFRPLFLAKLGRLQYFASLPLILSRLYYEVQRARVVHCGPSSLFRMFEFPAFLMGVLCGRVTVAVSDIDQRRSPAMNFRSGYWSRRQYWTTRLIHQPIMHLQHKVLARFGSVVMYKGAAFAADYGRNRSNVKNVLDVAFAVDDIISDRRLSAKVAAVLSHDTQLRICYFGRLVAYKGVRHILQALAHARHLGLENFRFDVFGDGEERMALERLCVDLELSHVTQFHGALPFGREFMRRLQDSHILLAAPLSEDTPRSALDAMASGQAVIAYDTYYYRDLKTAGAGVETVPWFDAEAMGAKLTMLAGDRMQLGELIAKAVIFARGNTQDIWLERRVKWTLEAVQAKYG